MIEYKPISYCDNRTSSNNSVFLSSTSRKADNGMPDFRLATIRNLRIVVSIGCKVESNTSNVSFRIGKNSRYSGIRSID